MAFFKPAETQPTPVNTKEEVTTARDVVWIEDKRKCRRKSELYTTRRCAITIFYYG